MMTMLISLTAVALGAALGFWTRDRLTRLGYRNASELELPRPGSRNWLIWTSALVTGSLAAVLEVTGSWRLTPVLLPLLLAGPALAATDLDVMRLPNRIVGPVALFTLAGLTATAVWLNDWTTPARAIAGGVIAGGCFWLMNVATRGGVGSGDTKLAALVGLVTGAVTLPTVWWALLVASVAAYAWTKATRHVGPLAYGPWLLAGAWVAVLAHPLS